MFAVTTPAGKRYEYVHPLNPGEKLNNSFATVPSDGQWLVSGEWGDQNRLRSSHQVPERAHPAHQQRAGRNEQTMLNTVA
ncbi:hypothetical protein [Streptomyces sp. NPDC054837]